MKRRISQRKSRWDATEAASVQLLESRTLLTSLSNGQEVLGTVAEGTNQEFDFQVDVGETVRFSVGEIGQTNATPVIEVFDSSGVSVGSDLDGVGVAVQITAESTGTYTAVVAESGDDAAFDFRARVVVLPGENSPGLIADRDRAMANGEEFESTLPSGSFSVFPFEVDTDETVRFSVGEIGQTNATPIIEVFDPSGVSIGSDLDGVGVAVQFTGESTGTYTAIVRESGNDAAFDFRARVVVLPGEDSPGLIADRDKALANGEEFESTLPSGSFSVFPFEVDTDATVRFSVGEIGQTNATPIVEVFDPSGVSVGSDLDGVGVAVQITTESTGTYTAIVRESGNDAAFNFRARVVVLPGQDSPGLIADRDKVLANGEEFESTLPSGVFS
ncbi:MAG: hypothetical protein AB8G99_16810, partial [Planctomycetaceae bacterium]